MTDFVNDSAESFSFAEVSGKNVTQAIAEAANVWSFPTANPYFIAGDLGIHNTALSLAEYTEMVPNRAPVGYSLFRDFVPGDYTFRRAYLDFVFTPIVGVGATLTLQQANVYTDVPDVVESGQATLASGGTVITFTKTFKVAPKVQITPIATAARQAVVTVAPTTTQFTARLFDTAGAGVAGDIIWTAVGY